MAMQVVQPYDHINNTKCLLNLGLSSEEWTMFSESLKKKKDIYHNSCLRSTFGLSVLDTCSKRAFKRMDIDSLTPLNILKTSFSFNYILSIPA